jgi:hypothetical protein
MLGGKLREQRDNLSIIVRLSSVGKRASGNMYSIAALRNGNLMGIAHQSHHFPLNIKTYSFFSTASFRG